ncbi:MAG: DUF29 domain-containing protein, partial [Candidatus Binataceae bacterium]
AQSSSRSYPAVDIETDYHKWLSQQARALRGRDTALLDWDNLAEELDAMGRSEENSLESYLEVLLTHLLKYAYQAEKRAGSWEASIENSRDHIGKLLDRSPNLKTKLASCAADAYPRARRTAGAEMGLDKRSWEQLLPPSCEWKLEQVLSSDFWPSR